jgi:uncharacterized FlaG/YvyC family protein
MKHLVGFKQKTVKVPFMETETVEVKKLTVAQVKEFQAQLEEIKEKDSADSGLAIQRTIIKMAVVGAEDLTDEELDSFPLEEIVNLAQKILELAGVRAAEGNDSAKKK